MNTSKLPNLLTPLNHLAQLKQALTVAHEFIQSHPCPDATDKTEDLYDRYMEAIQFMDIQQAFKAVYRTLEAIKLMQEQEAGLLGQQLTQDAISKVAAKSAEEDRRCFLSLKDKEREELIARSCMPGAFIPVQVLGNLPASPLTIADCARKYGEVPPSPIGSMPNRLTALELRVAALESLNPMKVAVS